MASADEVKYMQRHDLPGAIEALLRVATDPPTERPHEVLNWAPVIKTAKPPKLETGATCGATPDELRSLDFDIFAFGEGSAELLLVARDIFEAHGLLAEFAIAPDVFLQWIATVQLNYHQENPFHNFRHAVNVLQSLHVFLSTFDGGVHFSKLEVLAMLVAAVCHDLQHPGVNSAFLVETAHPLASRYANRTVLELHHSATALAVLDLRGHDIAAALRPPPATDAASFAAGARWRQFREAVMACILGTEVAAHHSHIAALKAANDAGFTADNAAHRTALMVALVEAADVSNEMRSFAFSRRWAPLVMEEFFRQGDAQRALGMPVKPMFDREVAVTSEEQVGFITFLCLPLFEELGRVLPAVAAQCVANLNKNLQTWKSMTED